MQRRILILLLAAITGAGAGFASRKLLQSASEKTSDGSPERSAPVATAIEQTPPARPQPTFEDFSKASEGRSGSLLIDYLKSATLDDIKALHSEEWLKLPGIIKHLDLIYLRAVELDAAGFVEWLGNANLARNEHGYHTSRAFLVWARVDPRAAFAATGDLTIWQRRNMARQLATNPDRDLAIEVLREYFPGSQTLQELEARHLEELAVTDAGGALELAKKIQADGGGSDALQKILTNWAASDPMTALAWVREQPDISEQSYLESAIILQLAESDWNAANRELATLPANAARMKLEGQIVVNRADKDPAGTLDTVLAIEDPTRRNFLFSTLAKQLAKDDPKRMLRLMVDNRIPAHLQSVGSYTLDWDGHGHGMGGSSDLGQQVANAAKKLALEEPRLAMAYLGTLGDPFTGGEIGATWADAAPAEAATFAAELPDNGFRATFEREVFNRWAQNAPQAAAEYASKHPALLKNSHMAASIAVQWAKKDPDAAFAWANTIEDSSSRDFVQSRLEVKLNGGQR